MNRLKRWTPLLFIFIGATLLTVLIWHQGWRELLSILVSAKPLPLALLMALLAGGYAIRALKWRIALGPDSQAAQLFFLAKSAGNWTPGRLGEWAPLLMSEHRNARIASWILADRVMEIWMTLSTGLLGVLAIAAAPTTSILTAAIVLVLGTIVGIVLVFVWKPPLPGERWAPRWRLYKLAHLLHAEMRSLGAKTPLLVGITCFAKVMDAWAVMALFSAFGYGVSFLLVCAARLAHALVSASPVTPDSTGLPYVAAAAILHEEAGIPTATLVTALTLEVVLIFGMAHLGHILVSLRMLGGSKKKEQRS